MALFPFEEDGKTGYIDARGKMILKPKWDAGSVFVNGVATASGWNERIYFDERGKELFRVPQMTHSQPFGPDGLAYVSYVDDYMRQRASFYDKKGKVTLLPVDDAWTPSEGLAAARKDRGKDTTWVGSPEWKDRYDNSKALWGYVDHEGKFVIAEQFSRAKKFFGGLAAVEKGKWGYIDKRGKLAIAAKLDAASDFDGDWASVCVKKKWGAIDRKGKLMIPAKFTSPLSFSEDVAAACDKPSQLGFIDRAGKFLGKARFLELRALHQGAAPARDAKSKKWGLVDRDGQWILKPQLELISEFTDGLARCTIRYSRNVGKSKQGYLNPKGELVFEYLF